MEEEIKEISYRQRLILSALRNILNSDNSHGQNDYLIGKIDITNLFIAQNEKDMAKRSFIQSQKQYWIAYHTLRQLTLYNFQKEKVIKALQ